MRTQNLSFSVLHQKATELKISEIRFLPRFVIVLIDSGFLLMAIGISFLTLKAINVSFESIVPIPIKVVAIFGVNLIFFRIFRTYSGLIRHSSFKDIIKLGLASFSTLLTLCCLHFLGETIIGTEIFVVPGLLLYSVLSFTFLLIFRIFIKQIFITLKEKNKILRKKRVAILGVDDSCISLGHTLESDRDQPFHLVGFLTEKPLKNISIAGKPVVSVKPSLRSAISSLNLDGVMIIGKNLSLREKNEVVNACLALKITVYNAPVVEEWDSTHDLSQNIKTVEIEDLLDREPIELDDPLIRENLQGKTILITGAAGSIGSELVRQIAPYKPGELILVDQAETPLYSLELELQEKFPQLKFRTILSTISNKYRMEALFKKYNFSLVYNAAAYKHVPMIEKNPREAIIVNLLGTVNLANLSSRYNVKKFVMVSTDKAVNPTNIMGASKRAAEMFVQGFQNCKGNTTQFITTRFGNVLGSNGSVIPYFREQIAKGGPVTVTHPEIIRYFMTIPEACQLVLQAGTMGKGGEIFVFDMGNPVKILDLAKRMIRLSGFKPYEDIDIKITGLRPGEKLFEELLSSSETTLPTHNKKIMILKVKQVSFEDVETKTKTLVRSAVRSADKKEMVLLLKQLVPEFISKNSEYEDLDLKVDVKGKKRKDTLFQNLQV